MYGAGEVENTEVVHENGERRVVVEGSDGEVVFTPTRDGFGELIRTLQRTRPTRDNAFREDPEPNQTSLEESAGVVPSDRPDDPSVWERADLSSEDIEELAVTEPELEPGDVLNDNDPSEW